MVRVGLLITAAEILVEWCGVRQISTDDRVDVGQAERAIRPDYGLSAIAAIEGIKHQLQEDSAVANPKHARRILPERNANCQGLEIHRRHGLTPTVRT